MAFSSNVKVTLGMSFIQSIRLKLKFIVEFWIGFWTLYSLLLKRIETITFFILLKKYWVAD